MTNNEIVPGFDNVKSSNLNIMLHNVNEEKNCLLIFLSGYIDTYNSVSFLKKIQKAIDAGFIKLIFQCSCLNYVSSSGIESFNVFLQKVKSYGGDIILSEMIPKVYDVFHMLGLSRVFKIKNDVHDAVDFFKMERIHEQLSDFPAVVSCPICEKNLKAVKSGRFRCSECKSILTIEESGHVSF